MSKFKKTVIVFLIIAVAAALAIASFWNDAVIVDEVPHIGAGYSYLTKGDYRLNPEHPPLAKDLAAIPLLFQNIDKESLFSTRFWNKDLNGQWEFGRFLLFKASPDAQLSTRIVKFPVLLFYILSSILLFLWVSKKYGDIAGFTALVLFMFSPTVMAHARFVTTDIAAAFGVLFSTYFFINCLKDFNAKNFWLACIFLGIALLTKFSTFLLVPFFLLIAVIYGWIDGNNNLSQRIATSFWMGVKSILIITFGFIIVVWPVYFLHTVNYPAEKQQSDARQNLSSFGRRILADPVVWASDKPILRPAAQYAEGLLMVFQRSVGGNTTYFLGDVSQDARKIYFPLVYFIKEPLAWWALVLIALLPAAFRLKRPKLKLKNIENWMKSNFVELTMLIWIAIYWYTSITSNLNIGVRHLMPVYPFSIFLVSGQIGAIFEKIKDNFKKLIYFSVAILAIFLWYILENIAVFPFYLTYFNQTVGGPTGGHKIVVDSNLDWGQDLKRINDFVVANNIEKIDFDYFGWADQSWYLKERLNWINSITYSGLEDFILRNPSNGWIAVSGSFLMGSRGKEYGDYEWLRQQTPVTVIGNSIFVYNLR